MAQAGPSNMPDGNLKPSSLQSDSQSTSISNASIERNPDGKSTSAKEASDEDYDEEEDDDYDPSKAEDKVAEESSDDEEMPDYSAVSGVSQVKTRGQIYSGQAASTTLRLSGLVPNESRVDVDALFSSLTEEAGSSEWRLLLRIDDSNDQSTNRKQQSEKGLETNEEEMQIRIVTTYTFAGRLVRESKLVAADSAEARAYLNSTSGLMASDDDKENHKSYVTVIRKVQGTEEERPLRIKLKRSSLIDKFLARDKKNKLTTLEKSRLDWASFVDKKKIKDDLAQHNKGGYLEKQAFLNRVENKRDEQYQQAKDRERQQQWQQQQKQG